MAHTATMLYCRISNVLQSALSCDVTDKTLRPTDTTLQKCKEGAAVFFYAKPVASLSMLPIAIWTSAANYFRHYEAIDADPLENRERHA
jgi:hypothetical protein